MQRFCFGNIGLPVGFKDDILSVTLYEPTVSLLLQGKFLNDKISRYQACRGRGGYAWDNKKTL